MEVVVGVLCAVMEMMKLKEQEHQKMQEMILTPIEILRVVERLWVMKVAK